jgi:hypothetical protein
MTSTFAQLAGLGGAANSAVPAPKPLAPTARQAGSPEFRKAFTDFVGQTFYGEMLKQMRASVDKPAFVHGGMGETIFQSQLDQVLVERMSDASASSFSGPMFDLLMAKRG